MLRCLVFSAFLLASAVANSKTVDPPMDLIQADFASPHLKTALDQCIKHPPGGKRYDCVQAKLLVLQLREKLLQRRYMEGVVTIAQ